MSLSLSRWPWAINWLYSFLICLCDFVFDSTIAFDKLFPITYLLTWVMYLHLLLPNDCFFQRYFSGFPFVFFNDAFGQGVGAVQYIVVNNINNNSVIVLITLVVIGLLTKC